MHFLIGLTVEVDISLSATQAESTVARNGIVTRLYWQDCLLLPDSLSGFWDYFKKQNGTLWCRVRLPSFYS
jgi:hypothetical protein